MAKTRVVVEGGGKNLYFVKDSASAFQVYKYREWGSDENIGTAATMNDALDRITSHSGKKIKSIG